MGYEKLESSVISDDELQLSGDVEVPFVELRELAAAPAVATDKATSRLYTLASDGQLRVKDSAGNVVNLFAGASLGDDARDAHENYQQAAASTLADALASRVIRAQKAGTIAAFGAEIAAAGGVAAAGESMTFDVTIGGVSALTAVVTIDDSIAVGTPVAGTIDTTANTFAAGDLIEVIRTYAAGGAPTPMTDTFATVTLQYAD